MKLQIYKKERKKTNNNCIFCKHTLFFPYNILVY